MDIDKAFQELIEKEELNIEAAFVEEFGLDERKMTDGEKEEREEIVKKLKPKLQSFKDRYGDDAKKVMYATATKQAMEEVEIDFREDALRAVARKATERKTGARGLRSILESVLLDVMYDIPSEEEVVKVVVDENVILGKSEPMLIYQQHPEQKKTQEQ